MCQIVVCRISKKYWYDNLSASLSYQNFDLADFYAFKKVIVTEISKISIKISQ